jgi:hypothetical protein
MWWHIGTFGHEAHVAKRAGIHDWREIRAVDGIELHGFGFVDQVEKFWETVTEIEATPTAMTDVEDAAQLLVQFRFIQEISVVPGERMPDRGV